MSLSADELVALSRLVIAAKAVRDDHRLPTTDSLVDLDVALDPLDGARSAAELEESQRMTRNARAQENRPAACASCGSAEIADALRLPSGTWKCLVCGAIFRRAAPPRPTAAQVREFEARFNTERRAR